MGSTAVILAAGRGTRMKSHLPKVLHKVLGKPMVQRAAETAEAAGVDSITVVVGHGRENVIPILESRGWHWAVQEEQLGTAHAVQCALPFPENTEEVVVLLGDVPLLRWQTVARLMEARRESGAGMAVLSTTPPEVTGYGRVICSEDGMIQRIVEEKDATAEEKACKVINTGIMVFKAEVLLKILPEIGNSNSQNEFYLTDAVKVVRNSGGSALQVFTPDWKEVAGVNDPVQLSACTDAMKKQVAENHLRNGVIIPDPSTVWIEDSVTIGRGAVIGRNCRLSGDTVIGAGARIGDGAVIEAGMIEPGAVVAEYSVTGVRQ
ncbi:hypothetical protein CSA37_03810 [Candidatus Fermentibacteria bacterium]|nr:MAG: hypothetical protein CSA37_03810 [Candidatus Fermentibacteria bacterium]